MGILVKFTTKCTEVGFERMTYRVTVAHLTTSRAMIYLISGVNKLVYLSVDISRNLVLEMCSLLLFEDSRIQYGLCECSQRLHKGVRYSIDYLRIGF